MVVAISFDIHKKLFRYFTKSTANLEEIQSNVLPKITTELTLMGLRVGQPIFIRIFKEERILEIWVKSDNVFKLFKDYEICNFSGDLGPKLK